MLSGCRTPSYLCVAPGGFKRLEIASDRSSNGGRPIAVDVVFATAKPAAAALSDLKARDYYAQYDQLRRDFPRDLKSARWEIQAGQQVRAAKLSPPCNVAGTFLFANYQSDGVHRVAIGKAKKGVLKLRADDIGWSAKK